MRSPIVFAIITLSTGCAPADGIRLAGQRMVDIDPPGLTAFHASRQHHGRSLHAPDAATADRFRREVVGVPRPGGVWSILMPLRLPDAKAFDDRSRLIGSGR